MIEGVESGKVKEFKMLRANQEDFMSYRNCEIEESFYSIHLFCNNGAKGYFSLSKEKNSKIVEGVFSYRGIAEIIKLQNNKGYIYGVY